MDLATIVLIAIGLSMDSLAVAVASGTSIRTLKPAHALKIGLFFGGFQALMPTVGWLIGFSLSSIIESFDHWMAFGLLTIIGARMIYEALKGEDEAEGKNPLDLKILMLLSIATSIDALAVGISLSLLNVDILIPALIIGAVCFAFSSMGVAISSRLAKIFGNKLKVVGGLILIAIGLRILLEHLLQ